MNGELPAAFQSRSILSRVSVWLFIVVLAWSPFPLGGAIAWAAGLQEILIALCWLLWIIGTTNDQHQNPKRDRIIVGPLVLGGLALFWAVVQITPGVPNDWVHPVWTMASEVLGTPLHGVISLNPWRTEAEILKLASYGMACWLVFQMARRVDTAALLLRAIAVIGSAYAIYAFALAFAGSSQVNVFYMVPYQSALISGPFMLHNSFATYCGLVVVAAVTRFFAKGGHIVVTGRGFYRSVHAIVSYGFGGGAMWLAAVLLSFSGVVASASRAGFAATMVALLSIALASLLLVRSHSPRLWPAIGTLAAALPLLFLIVTNGDTLGSRIDQLLASDTGDTIRFSLWASAQKMIADAPWLGLGLGTFEDSYPMYANQVFPFVMDKAHCDYLEFAAGLGLPAAIAWWTAMAWSLGLCLRGVRLRRRDRQYCVIAIGAIILVAIHSCVDFSLQMPAVALLCATLLGIGLAQSQSSR